MIVTCPSCKWSAEVSDEKIPDVGVTATCRKCQAKFEVKKESNSVVEQPPVSPHPATRETKPCPLCGEEILSVAKKCKHCGSMLEEEPTDNVDPQMIPPTSSPSENDTAWGDFTNHENTVEPPKSNTSYSHNLLNPKKFDWTTEITKKDKVIMLALAIVTVLVLFTVAKSTSTTFLWILTSYYLIKKGMTKWRAVGLGLLSTIILMPFIANNSSTNTTPVASTQNSTPTAPALIKSEKKAPEQAPALVKSEEKAPEPAPIRSQQSYSYTPSISNSQKNALKKAEAYLNHSAFSHDGLVAQLEYEQFSHTDAVYGADNSDANWNEQAAKKAKEYMKHSAFSRGSLIDQLKYEKFTQEQAEYGVNSVDL